jgi:hypothetical protein
MYEFERAFEVFDGLGILLRHVLPSRADLLPAFEKALLPVFGKLLEKNSDLVNFIFQIYAIVVERVPAPPETAQSLLASILIESNWQESNSSLFLSYIAFLKSYSRKVPDLFFLKQGECQRIVQQLATLGKDQSLLALVLGLVRQHDLARLQASGWLEFCLRLGFELYRTVGHNPGSELDSSRRTVRPSVNRYLVLLLCTLLLRGSPQALLQQADSIAPNLVLDILLCEQAMIARVQRQDRKTVLPALAALLTDCPLPKDAWPQLMRAVVDNVMNKRALWMLLKKEENLGTEDEAFKRLTGLDKDEAPFVD